MTSSHLILCHPLLLLPPIPPSIRVFSNESILHVRWSKYWSFNFSISHSNEHPGLISFRMDWLGFLVVQGTLKSLLQHHSSKASILQRSAFFTVQLSHPYMTTGKTTALTRRTFVGKGRQEVKSSTILDLRGSNQLLSCRMDMDIVLNIVPCSLPTYFSFRMNSPLAWVARGSTWLSCLNLSLPSKHPGRPK